MTFVELPHWRAGLPVEESQITGLRPFQETDPCGPQTG